MLNNKFKIVLFLLLILLVFSFNLSAVEAEVYNSPEAFTRFIYDNYAQKNFSEVYQKFVPELKRILQQDDYLNFQNENFKKYKLEYTEIEVGKAETIKFDKIKKQFSYADEFGDFFQLKVSYLIKFNRFGSREKESEKIVYLRKISDQYQLFWNAEPVLEDQNPESKADNNE